MMKYTVLIVTLLYCLMFTSRAFAQFSYPPNQVTLKGKVLSSEIFQVLGDSSTKVYTLVKKITYDAKGRVVLNYNNVGRSELHVYGKGKETIYACYDCDTNTLINLKHTFRPTPRQPNEANLFTSNPDNNEVTIHTRNNIDSLVTTKHYSASGYLTKQMWYVYQTDGKLKEVSGFNQDSQLVYNEKHTYTSNGHGIHIEHIAYNGYRNKYGYYKLYNTAGLIVEVKNWEENEIQHQTFTYETVGDTVKEFSTNLTNGQTKILRYTVKKPHLNIREVVDSAYEKREVYQYDLKNNLLAWEHFSKEGDLLHQITYTYDPKNNWKKAFQLNRITRSEQKFGQPKVVKIVMQPTQYEQRIIYFN